MKGFICVGVSASGKSTHANNYVREHPECVKIDRDDLRFSLRSARDWSEYKFDMRVEGLITIAHEAMIAHAGSMGLDVVIAETNLSGKTRNKMIRNLQEAGYEDIEIVEFPISLEDALLRDSLRQYSVGEEVIRNQYLKWEKYLENKRK